MHLVTQGLRSPTFVEAALLLLIVASTASQVAYAADAAAFPGVKWESVQTPESVGFSTPRIEVLRAWLKLNQTTALHVSAGGRTVFEYGDLAKVSKVASVRKSILALMFGKYVAEGKVDLNKSVEELGLGDVQAFLPSEKGATLLHLLTARSGIYHASGNESLTSLSPRRGSQIPGTYFQYQNWDFNAAGTAFEKLSGKNIFDALGSDLAAPIEMQDYDRSLQRKNSSMPDSVHPEYAMYLSTRDMARIGLLMLRKGEWKGKQIIPKDWTTRITTIVTPQNEIHPLQLGNATGSGRWGYGMLWWVWDGGGMPGIITGPYAGAYTAMGANGQFLTVLPAMDLVVTHKVNFDEDGTRNVSLEDFSAILEMIIAAHCSKCQ
jgi:CubicO group peptidase (beta-lactamase class C family)